MTGWEEGSGPEGEKQPVPIRQVPNSAGGSGGPRGAELTFPAGCGPPTLSSVLSSPSTPQEHSQKPSRKAKTKCETEVQVSAHPSLDVTSPLTSLASGE